MMQLKILVVEDDKLMASTIVKELQRRVKMPVLACSRSLPPSQDCCVKAEAVHSVSQALDKMTAHPFDILVVDLRVPGSSGDAEGGMEIIRASITADPLRPVIVVTGYGTLKLARAAYTAGIFDFIEKSTVAVEALVGAVQRAVDERYEKIQRSRNPFTPQSGEEPAFFGGRTHELQFLGERIDTALQTGRKEHFLVLGGWGVGKSSLLREYRKVCQSRGHVACIVPLEPLRTGTTLAVGARSIVGGILRALPHPVSRWRKAVGSIDSVGISVLGSGLELGLREPAEEHGVQSYLHDTLLRLWDHVKDETDMLVILLDDLDNVTAIPEIVTALKQTLSMDSIKATRILVGCACTPASWLELTSSEEHRSLARYFLSKVELSSLSEHELRDTIIQTLWPTGVSFEQQLLQHVYEYTHGHPFEMQLLCRYLFDNQVLGRVTLEAWDRSFKSALIAVGSAVFEQWLSKASPQDAQVLSVMARATAPMSAKDLRDACGSGLGRVSDRSLSKCLHQLTEKRLISKTGGGLYAVTDCMFRAYLCFRPSIATLGQTPC